MSDLENLALLNIFYNGTKKIRMLFHKKQIIWSNEKDLTGKSHTSWLIFLITYFKIKKFYQLKM